MGKNNFGKAFILRRMVLFIAGVVMIASLPATAGLLSKMNYMLHSWPRQHRVDKLIVTGNYVKPRLLAELVQHQTKNPILLISPSSSGNGKDLFFLPYGPKAMPLEKKDLVEFVDLVNPKQVLMLGDSDYLPEKIANRIQRQVSTVRVNSGNWAKNAQTLSDMFMYHKLPERFADMYDKLSQASPQPVEGGGEPSASSPLAPLQE